MAEDGGTAATITPTRVLAVVIVALLLAGAATAVVVAGDRPAAVRTGGGSTTTTTSTTATPSESTTEPPTSAPPTTATGTPPTEPPTGRSSTVRPRPSTSTSSSTAKPLPARCRTSAPPTPTTAAVAPFQTTDPAFYVMRPDGRDVRVLFRSRHRRLFYGVAWSPSEPVVVLSDGIEMWRVPLDGKAPTRLAVDLPNPDSPRFSPDGARLVFTARIRPDAVERSVYTMTATGTDLRRVTPVERPSSGATWSPDGTSLLVHQGRSLVLMDVDGRNGRDVVASSGAFSVSWSPDATAFAAAGVSGDRNGLDVFDRGGRHVRHVNDVASEVAWSPGCGRLATKGFGQRLDVLAPDGSASVTAYDPAAHAKDGVGDLHWSPDSAAVLHVAHATRPAQGGYEYDTDVVLTFADGRSRVLVDMPFGQWQAHPRGWAPDGSLIGFAVESY